MVEVRTYTLIARVRRSTVDKCDRDAASQCIRMRLVVEDTEQLNGKELYRLPTRKAVSRTYVTIASNILAWPKIFMDRCYKNM